MAHTANARKDGEALSHRIEQSTATEGVTYVPVDHPVFRQREAQVQTATGRRPSLSATQFTELLMASLRRDRHSP